MAVRGQIYMLGVMDDNERTEVYVRGYERTGMYVRGYGDYKDRNVCNKRQWWQRGQ